MIIERKEIQACSDSKHSFGHISLDKLAIPETVVVKLNEDIIIPISFDQFGHPRFTMEQYMLYMYKESEINRNSNNFTPLEVEVQYEEDKFLIHKKHFDSLEGIGNSLSSLSSINQMLNNRKRFIKANTNARLNSFVIFGYFYLDEFGQIMSIDKKIKNEIKYTSKVESCSSFYKNNEKAVWSCNGFIIPEPDSVCPCCGKKLTIDDIIYNPCINKNGKTFHYSCYRNFEKLSEIDKLTTMIMNVVYKKTDYTFDLLPNGYCKDECCSHIPWILFHTVDGDIIIGTRKRVISIEWQENYTPFDLNLLFADEDVTKWTDENGKRGIHSYGTDKACQYLRKVLKNVNPTYSLHK